MFPRLLQLPKTNSFFLFGARGTGKSTLLQQTFGDEESTLWLDFLLPSVERRFHSNPEELVALVQGQKPRRVILDEVQKVPKILDVVHYLIEKTNIPFVLTGSSARKLKQKGVNLLAGRAFLKHLFPITWEEWGSDFNLQQTLRFGTLPRVINAQTDGEKKEFLESYAHLYLKEEIAAEQVLRKIDSFRSFLEVAAQTNGKIINFTKISRDVAVDVKTIQSFFQILEHTLMGFFLEVFAFSARKRVGSAPKFYFFDLGVTRALSNQLGFNLLESTSVYGEIFEHFVILEIYRKSHYLNKGHRVFYYHDHNGAEIDLVLQKPNGNITFIEIKSAKIVKEEHLKNLKKLQKSEPNAQYVCLCQDVFEKEMQGIRCLPWQVGLGVLFE